MKIAKLFIVLFVFNINAYAQEEDYAEVEWIRTYIGPDSVNSVSKGMTLDNEGNVYVAIDDVAATDSGYSYDFIFVKYDNDGKDGLNVILPLKALIQLKTWLLIKKVIYI